MPRDESWPRTVAITGSHGFLGSALTRSLRADGTRVIPIVRKPDPSAEEIGWSPRDGEIEEDKLEGLDAVVHLAGESILGVWTPAKKERIYASRSEGTSLLARALATRSAPPPVLISTSAVGYYGDAGDTILTESAPPGDDFLAETCVEWENATRPAEDAGIRVVHNRMGLILDRSGGALHLMLPIFRLGLGGKLGSGKQWMSWVTLEDAVGAVRHGLANHDVEGPVNVTAPEPVRNAEFTRALASALDRPAVLSVPKFALRATGGMGDELLLASQRAIPERLQATGYAFEHPALPGALRAILDEPGPAAQTV